MFMVSVLLVCLGNICRSPSAQGVLRKLLAEQGLTAHFSLDSAGTGGWHVGKTPDPRAIKAAARRGIDISDLRARQVTLDDFDKFDYILAMDSSNHADLRAMQPENTPAKLERILAFAPAGYPEDVPDPYYGGDDGFDSVLDLITDASQAFIAHIMQADNT